MAVEFTEGRPVPEIAARYGVTEAYVDRVIEQTSLAKPKGTWSLDHWVNRLVVSLIVGWLAWMATGKNGPAVLVFAAVVFYAIVTAIVSRRRD
jgi:hypothetical protein